MSMGRRQKHQSPLWIAHDELAPSPGHRFYETLNAQLREAAFDRRAEALCAPYYEAAQVPGRKSVAPGVYFRMHLVGFFEGIESERGLEWRFADDKAIARLLVSQIVLETFQDLQMAYPKTSATRRRELQSLRKRL